MQSELSYNPDVLTCLANLSSDEIFTPPELVNKILDILPPELWSNKDARFLDPMTKSGVFLREIAKRLMKGLEKQIPDQEKRINHVFKNQIFGIAITELTALLARRSVYCSKTANGKYSVCNDFTDEQGNIRFNRIEHTWINGKCKFCRASEENYERGTELETHAYEFIHTTTPEELFNMKFDVIIGNPPYQMSDGGAFASSSPIYNKFVEQALKLNPRFLIMIIPARWYAGGKGLDDFRNKFLKDKSIKILHDFPIGEDCFPGIRIAGGVCYFLRDSNYSGECKIISHKGNEVVSEMLRPLLEKNADTFIRINEAVSILRKINSINAKSFSSIVSSRKPFGLPTDFLKDPTKYDYPPVSETTQEIKIIGTINYKTVERYVGMNYPLKKGLEAIEKYKVFISQVLDNGFDWTKERLKPFLGYPKDICTETFLIIGPFEKKEEAENAISYINTKLFHLLMFLKKISHHVTAKVYSFVPIQNFNESWSDEKLYKKYGLTAEEIKFIEVNIKDLDNE